MPITLSRSPKVEVNQIKFKWNYFTACHRSLFWIRRIFYNLPMGANLEDIVPSDTRNAKRFSNDVLLLRCCLFLLLWDDISWYRRAGQSCLSFFQFVDNFFSCPSSTTLASVKKCMSLSNAISAYFICKIRWSGNYHSLWIFL